MTRAARGVLLVAVCLILSCGGPSDPPSIVLVTIDTARWDAYGAYGDPLARTPVFDALARRGALFRNAFVDAPTTLPSHTTMMTGAVSLRHGVRMNGAFSLPDEAVTLAEVLADSGYETAAVVSSVALMADRGLAQGFTVYNDSLPETFEVFDPALEARSQRFAGTQRRANETTVAAVHALGALHAPAFLWVHYVDPHLTYDPPPPWNGVPGLSAYAGEIAFADQEMGRLLRAATEALGDVTVAVISDHGEGLGDHREDEHGMFLYDTTIRVPFLIASPGAPARVASGLVRNADLAPALASLAGLAADFPDGVDVLTADAPPQAAVLSETLSPTRYHGGAPLKALRSADRKFVLAPEPEVYDLEADPGESHNRLDAEPAAEAMRRDLVRRVADILSAPGIATAESAPVDEKRAEALRALGYLVSGDEVDAARETEPDGIDPKHLIDVTRSVKYVMDGRWNEARERMTRFWEEHPEPPDDTWHALYSRAWLCESLLALAQGRVEDAEALARDAVRYDATHREAQALLQRIREFRAGG